MNILVVLSDQAMQRNAKICQPPGPLLQAIQRKRVYYQKCFIAQTLKNLPEPRYCWVKEAGAVNNLMAIASAWIIEWRKKMVITPKAALITRGIAWIWAFGKVRLGALPRNLLCLTKGNWRILVVTCCSSAIAENRTVFGLQELGTGEKLDQIIA